MKYSIIIVDDHLLIAKAITSIIDTFRNFHTLIECENGQVMIEQMKNRGQVPDIVLMDISMPIMDGFEATAWLRDNHPEVLIMALTMQGDEDALLKMIKAGAHGYLQKNVHPTELEKALSQLVEKKFYYPDWATSKILRAIGKEGQIIQSGPAINDREKEFLTWACSELTYKEIAIKMHCSPRTVESYRDHLFEKLGVKTRVALALYAVKTGIITL